MWWKTFTNTGELHSDSSDTQRRSQVIKVLPPCSAPFFSSSSSFLFETSASLKEKRGIAVFEGSGKLMLAAGACTLNVRGDQAWPYTADALYLKIHVELGSGWVLISPLTSMFPHSMGLFIHKAEMMSDRSYSSVKPWCRLNEESFSEIHQSMC